MRYRMLQQSITYTNIVQTLRTRGLIHLMLYRIFARELNHYNCSLCIFAKRAEIEPNPIMYAYC